MNYTINNSRAPQRLRYYRERAASAKCGPRDWRDMRWGWLGHGANWRSKETRGYVAMDAGVVSGLRNVGYSDELLSYLPQRGYYAGHWQDETYRGQVWQLPARDGRPVYICGYLEHDAGTLILSATVGMINVTDEKETAARGADQLAEEMAEWQREDSEAQDQIYRAQMRITESRREFSEAVKGYKAQKAAGAIGDYVCGLLKNKMQECRDEFKKALADLEAGKDRADTVARFYAVK